MCETGTVLRSLPLPPPPVACLAVYAVLLLGNASGQTGDPTEFFERRVRPLLAENCFACHTSMKMGGLEMKSRKPLTGGKRGPAIVAGKPEQSLLMKAVGYQVSETKDAPQREAQGFGYPEYLQLG